MHVVTAGTPFIDIDSYACSVALAELLRLQGEDAIATSSTRCNASVPPIVQSWDTEFTPNYKPTADDVFTLVDISDYRFFDPIVDLNRVVGVIDHHPGHDANWHEKLGNKAVIEPVGAACTLVYERWLASGSIDRMSQTSARLLVCGILDNTLNLGAVITTGRDRSAYTDLLRRSGLGADWPAQYFTACQQTIRKNLAQSLGDDTKVISYPGRTDTVTVGQLALWEADDLLLGERDTIRHVLSKNGSAWYVNLIDIEHSRSIFWCEEPALRAWLSNLLKITFSDDTATADRMWLRKEIMGQAIKKEGS